MVGLQESGGTRMVGLQESGGTRMVGLQESGGTRVVGLQEVEGDKRGERKQESRMTKVGDYRRAGNKGRGTAGSKGGQEWREET